MHVAYIIVVVAVQEEDYGKGELNFTLKSHSSSSSYGGGVGSTPRIKNDCFHLAETH